MALHGAIDDATGIVTAAIFRPTKDLWGYLMMMEKGIRQYGVPLALYSDQHTIFFSPQTPLSIEQEVAGETDVLTQFGAALSELRIEHICTYTPSQGTHRTTMGNLSRPFAHRTTYSTWGRRARPSTPRSPLSKPKKNPNLFKNASDTTTLMKKGLDFFFTFSLI